MPPELCPRLSDIDYQCRPKLGQNISESSFWTNNILRKIPKHLPHTLATFETRGLLKGQLLSKKKKKAKNMGFSTKKVDVIGFRSKLNFRRFIVKAK